MKTGLQALKVQKKRDDLGRIYYILEPTGDYALYPSLIVMQFVSFSGEKEYISCIYANKIKFENSGAITFYDKDEYPTASLFCNHKDIEVEIFIGTIDDSNSIGRLTFHNLLDKLRDIYYLYWQE